jgi:endonuclease-3 related protein
VFDYPVFIADTYARRLFHQHGVTQANNYRQLQKQLVLPAHFTALQAKELHGLIVEYGKLKTKPMLNWPS